ncbi:MAG: hypothetical protein R2856_00690 [Caldilineaceae bacterium]
MSNASAIAVEHLPVAKVTNLNRAIDTLKETNVVASTDMGDDTQPLEKVDLTWARWRWQWRAKAADSAASRGEKCDF